MRTTFSVLLVFEFTQCLEFQNKKHKSSVIDRIKRTSSVTVSLKKLYYSPLHKKDILLQIRWFLPGEISGCCSWLRWWANTLIRLCHLDVTANSITAYVPMEKARQNNINIHYKNKWSQSPNFQAFHRDKLTSF